MLALVCLRTERVEGQGKTKHAFKTGFMSEHEDR